LLACCTSSPALPPSLAIPGLAAAEADHAWQNKTPTDNSALSSLHKRPHAHVSTDTTNVGGTIWAREFATMARCQHKHACLREVCSCLQFLLNQKELTHGRHHLTPEGNTIYTSRNWDMEAKLWSRQRIFSSKNSNNAHFTSYHEAI
jgi:hypothetical protein